MYLQRMESSPLKHALELRFSEVPESPKDFAALPESTSPWPVPELLAHTRFLFEQVIRAAQTGRNVDAQGWYTLAVRRADSLLEIARSHPEGWRLRCLLESRRIGLTLTGSAPPAFNPIPCENLLVVDPASDRSRLAVGEVFVREGRSRLSHGEDPASLLNRGEAVAMAVDDETNPLRLKLLAQVSATRVGALQRTGTPPAGEFTEALDRIRSALDANPHDPGLLADFASVTNIYSTTLYAQGEDVDAILAEASELLDEGLLHRPDAVLVHLRTISLKTDRAYYGMLAGRDVGAILEDAVHHGREAAKRFPDHLSIRNAHAMAARTLAEFRDLIGDDPQPAAEESIALYQAILEEQPNRFFTRFNMIGPYITHLRWDVANSARPRLLKQARKEVEELVSRASNPDEVAINVSALLLVELRLSLQNDTWDASIHRQIRDRINVGLDSEYDRTVALSQLAELTFIAARQNALLHKSALLDDLEILARALEQSPELVQVTIYGAQAVDILRHQGIKVPASWGSLKQSSPNWWHAARSCAIGCP